MHAMHTVRNPILFFSVFLVSVWGYEVRGTWRPIFVWYASWRDLDPIKIDQKFNSDIEHSLCLKMLVEKKRIFWRIATPISLFDADSCDLVVDPFVFQIQK